jgi:hypothetical protein
MHGEASNIKQFSHQQQHELTTKTLATVGWRAVETIGTSKTSTAEGRPATAGMPATEETSTTLLASVWTIKPTEMPKTVLYGRQQLMSFRGNNRKIFRTAKNS